MRRYMTWQGMTLKWIDEEEGEEGNEEKGDEEEEVNRAPDFF